MESLLQRLRVFRYMTLPLRPPPRLRVRRRRNRRLFIDSKEIEEEEEEEETITSMKGLINNGIANATSQRVEMI